MRPPRNLIHALGLALVLAVASLTVGCEYVLYDLELLEFQPAPDGGGQDTGDGGTTTDIGDGGDGFEDVGDVGDTPDADTGTEDDAGDAGDGGDTGGPETGPDTGPDSGPVGPFCTRDFAAVNPDRCHPVKETGCPPQAPNCDIVISGGMPGVGCSTNPPGTRVAGDVCTSGSDCGNGLTCVSWSSEPDPRSRVCTAFCELETGYGCTADEFCTRSVSLIAVDMPGLGFCAPRCDPYDPAACEVGQTCSTDYHYPQNTCLPEFRCVLSTGSGVAEGGSCVANDSSRMCERGLVCLEQICVKPCQDEAECGGGTCGTAQTDFQLRYCQ